MSKAKLHPSRNALPAKARAQSIALLNQALADLIDLYSQAKQAHWNVRGKKFFMLVANSVRATIDTATGAGDADTADLLTGVSRDLDKALWFLEASA